MGCRRSILLVLLQIWKWPILQCAHQEVCDESNFIVTCEDNEAILAEKATFGRMRLGKCVLKDFGYLGCENEVLDLVDKWCSGLEHCHVEVSNAELERANSACAADLNSYLEVDYTCVPVIRSDSDCSTRSSISISNTHGHISSHVTSQTGCGSPKAPWVIEAQPGQTVHLWLIDFGALDRQHQSLYTSCHQLYGFIIERDLGVNLTMCGGTERKTEIYRSKTNKVEVHLLASKKDKARYFVEYTFIGCPDLSPPAHAWYKREGNEAVIGCKSNDRVWRLYCNGNTWNGVVGNCSKADFRRNGPTVQFGFTFSTVIILTCVVCAAILLIIVVVVAGIVYVKKQRIKHELKLRSDYGMISQAQYYTLKGGYGINTMTCSSTQLPTDSQPLVHIVDKIAIDTGTAHSENACSAMPRSIPEHNESMKKETNTSTPNLI